MRQFILIFPGLNAGSDSVDEGAFKLRAGC